MRLLPPLMTFLLPVIATPATHADTPLTGVKKLQPNLIGNTERPLRYRPENRDFVIINGPEFFNRPLYGGNTAFRLDAGDKPEFSLYLPGRGGNLRLGLRTSLGARWLSEAETCVARYRPGAMIYEIRDPLLGPTGVLKLTVVALETAEGLVLCAAAQDVPSDTELIWAYGGVTGQRGVRDGDIGTERVPISEYFQLKPEFCRDNRFTLSGNTFTLHSRPATIAGVAPAEAQLRIAVASHWASCTDLLTDAAQRGKTPTEAAPLDTPVLVGWSRLRSDSRLYLALQRVDGSAAEELAVYRDVSAQQASSSQSPAAQRSASPISAQDLPEIFARAERHFDRLRSRVSIETPDPFLDAAVGALNIAADAVWDEPQGVVMHGAIAWRSRLLGWRGPYAMDALGWHDRARRHLAYWATRQNLEPVPDRLPPPDEDTNLARSRAALHSHGNLSNSHYDMNLVYIDALFRHLLWTGDIDFAREVWPVVERHLAWERRLFRREFTNAAGEKLPLYEAYAAIWASDDLQYHGGGVSYASAYNHYHNEMAARLARLLGHDATPYEREAALIARGLREHLWLEERGLFAEFKDLLGHQLVHPSPGLWSVYHLIDSQVTTPAEAWRMTEGATRHFPLLPIHGRGVPQDMRYGVFSTTNWMPYTWSVNNVVMGENVHTALAFWQAGRADDAYRLTKSALLAAMYMGICPGNVGSMSYLDVYRRESQRDFADGSGVLSRALVEGLFGVRPDALAGKLTIEPGLPAEWTHARLQHPNVALAYRSTGDRETFTIGSRFDRPMALTLRVPARSRQARVSINGRPAQARLIDRGPAPALLEIQQPPAAETEITIEWKGERIARPDALLEAAAAEALDAAPAANPVYLQPFPATARPEPLDLAPYYNDRVTQIFRNEYRSPRSPYVSLAQPKQGIGAWAGHVNATAEVDDSGLRAKAAGHSGRLILPNGIPIAIPGPGTTPNVLFTSQWDNYPNEATVPLAGRARHVYLLMAGSTNWMQSRIDNGDVLVRYVDGTIARLALHNPTNWWPIDQDYFIDDYQFRRPEPIPPRVDLKTGEIRMLDVSTFKGHGAKIPGGAATVLELALDPTKELDSLTVRALANEVVIGLLGATLVR
jgi:hypothetical protein